MRTFIALLLITSAAPAVAGEMRAIDLAVYWQSLVGQEVIATGCIINAASLDWVQCSLSSATGDELGSFYLDSPSMDRPSLRRALDQCGGFDRRIECRATVTGTVYADELSDRPFLVDVKINWP